MLMAALVYGIGFHSNQSNFDSIIQFYLPLFLVYLGVIRWAGPEQVLPFLYLSGLLRLILVFAFPSLSDDVYRFIWDGRLLINGWNPFDHLPAYYLEQNISVPGLTQALYQELNSPNYFTIYPPVAQAVFALACWLFPASIPGSALVMKLFLFCCEMGSLVLLWKLVRHFQLPQKNVLLYALNPLIIVEITGNLHFEGAMIFFLLLAYWWLIKQRYTFSAIAIALSVASKLLPLIFLPFLIRRLGWTRSVRYFLTVGLTLALLFAPLFSGLFLENFGNSLDLYFRKFEFNASIYYLARWIGYQTIGWNMIQTYGPLLALGTFLGILLMALLEKKADWFTWPCSMLFAICLYLLFTTTVHPWYASLPIVLCLFTRFRFPILWSGMIFLTYVNYSYEPYWENLWVVGVEYSAVIGYIFWELFNKLRENRLQNKKGNNRLVVEE